MRGEAKNRQIGPTTRLSIRMTISKAQCVGVDEAVFAKLLFARIDDTAAYAELVNHVSVDTGGKPTFLKESGKRCSRPRSGLEGAPGSVTS